MAALSRRTALIALLAALLLMLASCGPDAPTLAERYVNALEAGRIEQANEIRDRVTRRGERYQAEFLTHVEESLSSSY